jgi:hypothetical protein
VNISPAFINFYNSKFSESSNNFEKRSMRGKFSISALCSDLVHHHSQGLNLHVCCGKRPYLIGGLPFVVDGCFAELI